MAEPLTVRLPEPWTKHADHWITEAAYARRCARYGATDYGAHTAERVRETTTQVALELALATAIGRPTLLADLRVDRRPHAMIAGRGVMLYHHPAGWELNPPAEDLALASDGVTAWILGSWDRLAGAVIFYGWGGQAELAAGRPLKRVALRPMQELVWRNAPLF